MDDPQNLNVKRSPWSAERSASSADAANPWPGLSSFTEESRGLFFGRDRETDELARLVRRETLSVLFGQSGLGKSSLLQAGLFPLLRENDHLPLYLRLDHAADAPALAEQVKAALNAAFAAAGADAPVLGPEETLWEYFHRKDVDIWSARNRLLTPVLAFDQFEEIFTLGRADDARRERSRAFLTELADLIENRPPAALREQFDAGEADPAAYTYDKPSCRVILSLREDFLPDLEGLKQSLPALVHNRLRLKRLNGAQALEAVTRPAPHLLAEGVGEKIVEFVAGTRGGSTERLLEMEVEPALLSVICRELNERRRALGQAQITADLVSGNRREILTDFYERSVADLPEGMRAFVEDHLLTKSGYRDNLALETALDFPGVTRPLIDTLVSRRLLRIEDRLGVQRVELTHDVLADVIRASRDARQQRLAIETERQRERLTRRRMWLARVIAAGLLVAVAGVSWIAWRAIDAERAQGRLRAQAEAQELAARRKAYASDINALQEAIRTGNFARMQMLLNRQRPQPGQKDLRGWEWRYLWQFAQSDAQGLLGQGPDSLARLAASADGKWVAAATLTRGPVTVWNLQTREAVRLPDLADEIAFSPREPLLAIFDGHRVILWDVAARRALRTLTPGTTATPSGPLFFSEDGQTLATAIFGVRGPGEIALWRVATGEKLTSHPLPNAEVPRFTNFAVSRDLKLAAYTTAADVQVHVLDLTSGKKRWSARAAVERTLALSFSPDGKILASSGGYDESAIRLWDTTAGVEIGRLEGHQRFSAQLRFFPDGKTLASASGDHTIRLWDIPSRRLLRTLRGHKLEAWSVALLPDNRTVVSGGKDGEVLLWDTTARPAANAVTSFPSRAADWRFSGDNQGIILLEPAGQITERRGDRFAEQKTLLQLPPSHAQLGARKILSSDSPRVAHVAADQNVETWDWERGERVGVIAAEKDAEAILPLSFGPRGETLFVIRGTRESLALEERAIVSGAKLRSWPRDDAPNRNWLLRLVLSPDGKRALGPLSYTELTRLDLVSGGERKLPLDLRNTVSPGRFSPDGSLFAVATEYGLVQVVGVDPLRRVTTLSGFVGGMHSTAFSPDGTRLAAGSGSSEAMMLWDVASFERLLTVSATGSLFSNTTFSPDGNVIGARSGSSASGGAMHFWRAPSWAEIEKAEQAAAKVPR